MSKIITRKYIQRITRREGDTSIRRSSGGGGGGGGVSQYWVDDNYVSKEFFNRLFEIHDENGDPILPNDVETEIDNIQAMFGFWTNAYLSALGQNDEGGGAELTLASLADVAVQGVANGQALVWSASQGKWVPGEGGGGSVTSIVTGGTTYSPTNGVVTLPDNIVYDNDNANYLGASFLKSEYSQKAAQKYIEFWDSAGGWFNFMLGTLYATSDVKVGNNSVIHTGNIGSQSVNYATSAGNASTADLANMIKNDITVTSDSSHDNGIRFSNGTRSVLFGTGTSGNTGIYLNNIGWIVGVNPSGESFLNGNATSASKLATARTIWGQSFDGTANISGNMTDVGSISASGNNTITKTSEDATFAAVNNNGRIELHASTNRGVYDGTQSRWLIATNGTNSWLPAGNVGIGTTSPSYKLHVEGTFYASGNSSIGGTFGVTGATTLSSTLGVTGLLTASGGITIPSGKTLTIGDAVLSWDSTNQGIKITKGLYSETFISALGKGNGGSSGISIETVWTALANSDSSKQISISHLTNALSGYNPTSNFKTINGESIIGTGDIAISAGTGTVTSIVTGGTTYSPTNGVVTLPDNIVYDNYNANYLGASFLKSEYSQKAAQKHIEFWDSAGGWFNFMLGTLYVVNNVGIGTTSPAYKLDVNGDVRADNFIGNLANKSVTASTIDGLAGSFTFEGDNLINNQYDGVGLQVGSSVDKAQLLFDNGTIRVRQNDSGGTNSSDWTAWTMLPTKVFTKHQLTKTDQWYRVANLTTYGLSYIISIGENYYNREPTPATFIINTSYTNATITQIGRAALTPVSITKVRLVKYGNGTFHVEVYTPKLSGSSSASMNMPKVNIFNLGRENTSDGIALVHDPNDDTKWLEVDKNIASGETLIEEADISTGTMIAGDILLNNAQYIGWKNKAGTAQRICIGLNSSNDFLVGFTTAGSGYNTYLDGNSVSIRYGTSRTSGIYLDSSGNVGIGTTSPSYKLHVEGTGYYSSNLLVQSISIGNTNEINATGSNKLWLQYRNSGALVLCHNGANCGVGADNPSYKLHVGGTFYASGNSSIGGTFGVTGATTLSSTLSVSGTSTLTGHVGIGTSPHSTYVLRANGEVYVSTGLYSHGYVTALSDIRHKDVMGDVKLTVSEVANAPAVKFLWKDRRQEGLQVGSIAQYWQKVLPEAIVEAADGELTMSYGVIALLASIANAREIVNLKREISELKRKLSNHGILE